MSRITFDESAIRQLEIIKERSTCPRLHTAALIASWDNRILCTGYNGSLPGQSHCDDVTYCTHCTNGIKTIFKRREPPNLYSSETPVQIATQFTCAYCGGHYAVHTGCLLIDGHCKRTVHAEANAILQAARFGTPVVNTKMYSLHTPCIDCTKMIVTVGISELIIVHGYRTDENLEAREMLEKSNVMFEFANEQ